MRVTLGKEGLSKTWQEAFEPTVMCSNCYSEALIAFVAHEGLDEDDADAARVYDMHTNKGRRGRGGYWLHDRCAVAVYICQDCFEATAIFNQG